MCTCKPASVEPGTGQQCKRARAGQSTARAYCMARHLEEVLVALKERQRLCEALPLGEAVARRQDLAADGVA
jgi:hypothetical protein